MTVYTVVALQATGPVRNPYARPWEIAVWRQTIRDSGDSGDSARPDPTGLGAGYPDGLYAFELVLRSWQVAHATPGALQDSQWRKRCMVQAGAAYDRVVSAPEGFTLDRADKLERYLTLNHLTRLVSGTEWWGADPWLSLQMIQRSFHDELDGTSLADVVQMASQTDSNPALWEPMRLPVRDLQSALMGWWAGRVGGDCPPWHSPRVQQRLGLPRFNYLNHAALDVMAAATILWRIGVLPVPDRPMPQIWREAYTRIPYLPYLVDGEQLAIPGTPS